MAEALNTTTEMTHRVDPIIEMFIDATVGESYKFNRMLTEEEESGNVVLTGYTWMKLAEYDEDAGEVTVFFGHKSVGSKTVSRWLNRIVEIASQRRDVTISHESPVVREPNDGVEFINEYVGNWNEMSAVEKAAMKAVRKSLDFL